MQVPFTPAFQASDQSRARRALRVLVVDDDRDTIVTLAALLREDGHDVRAAYNGRFALRSAAEFKPEAVLLDINLPEINGWEVARQLRRVHVSPRPTIIALSGVYKKAADKLLAEIARIDHYLAKPYDPNTLLALLAPLSSALTA